MCLGIPMKVIDVEGATATVETGGVRRQVNVQLVDEVEPGQYLIVHAGFAISVLDEATAEETLALITDALAAGTAGEPTGRRGD